MTYFDRYGVEFSEGRKTLTRCPKDFKGDYIIPNGVTRIGHHSFEDAHDAIADITATKDCYYELKRRGVI